MTEKSNTEYILYKNDYITLNAYNKKTGGSMSNLIARKILSNEKNEFEIPIDNKNQYNENISKKISTYLKQKWLIPNSNNKLWIITDNTNNIKVKGYTTDEINKQNSETSSQQILIVMEIDKANIEYYKIGMYKIYCNYYYKISDIKNNGKKYEITLKYTGIDKMNKEIKNQNTILELIRYGQEKHIENVKQYNNISDISDITDEQKTNFNIKITNDANNKYDIKQLLYYYELANDDGINAYNKLNNDGYFIYTLIEAVEYIYKIKNTYLLYNTLFECIHIYNKSTIFKTNYSMSNNDDIKIIVFKYIGNGLSLPVITGGGQRKYKRLNYY